MKQFLYRLITIIVLISSIGLVKAGHCCRSFVPDFLSWFNQLNDEQIRGILKKDTLPANSQGAMQVDVSGLDPVELRAYLLFKKGKLPKDAHQELSQLFKDLQDPKFQNDEDIDALRQALGTDLQTVLQKYQADDMSLQEVQEYIENLHDWWNREDGDEDWGNDNEDENEKEIDPAADALLRALKSRSAMQDDFPAAPALPKRFKK